MPHDLKSITRRLSRLEADARELREDLDELAKAPAAAADDDDDDETDDDED